MSLYFASMITSVIAFAAAVIAGLTHSAWWLLVAVALTLLAGVLIALATRRSHL